MTVAAHEPQVRQAVAYLVGRYSPKGNRVGWLMIASIFIESWDLYSIAFVLVFLKEQFNPSALMLGLTAGATQAGAVIGALAGGWLSDKIGRRAVFLGTMVIFIVAGAAQGFAPSMLVLALIRLILGIPLGMDIANGYTYIMEFLPRDRREVMGNRWQFMFAVGEIAAIGLVTVGLAAHMDHELLWRLILGLSAVPALILFLFRFNLPETAAWLIERGRFREAKQVTSTMYGDPLDMLPDHDVDIPKPKLSRFLADIRTDRSRWRATLFGWTSCFAQGSEFSTFAFYMPTLFVLVGVSSVLGTNLISLAVYTLAAISGFVGPLLVPKIGQRNLSIYGFSMVLVSLIVAGVGLLTGNLAIVPFAAAVMLWGHYWAAENGMTISSVVAAPRYRGTASGFAYIFVKIPSFMSIFLFPSLFDAIGKGGATLFTAIFPLIGLLAAIFVLPKVYAHGEDEAGLAEIR
ncbi:MFS transporter [Planosporangium mesophilum]|uniref:MFS transporter n=1 Tax=Planosporangium mesophilum TaxID=689768 RepID=A0A8J3TAC2_9ACTN|nr:MFS transporter [Planosporangium mesophilum]NJC83987.1 sugar porter family MFS transporter [Planosporangium mesophilum]GII22644.1 MFS transporter [Planosporangium mesophilum]